MGETTRHATYPCPACGARDDVWEHYRVLETTAYMALRVLVCNPCGAQQTTVILPKGTKVEFK